MSQRIPYSHDQFVDRAAAVRVVLDKVQQLAAASLATRRVVIFHGARGAGKSWLLHELDYLLKRDFSDTLAVYISLEKFSGQSADGAVQTIIKQIDSEVAVATGLSNMHLAYDLSSHAQYLVENVRRLKKVLVLLFDYVDESLNDLLSSLEDHCLSRLMVEPDVLVVLAGRGKQYVWKDPAFRFQSDEHDLPPFDPVQTLEQLTKQAPQAAMYADEIYDLSGGNPWSNYLLRTLPESRVATLQQTQNALLGTETHLLTQPYLEALCVLRTFDENRMPSMFVAHFKEPITRWTYAACKDIRSRLTEARLAHWDRDKGEFSLDQGIRTIVENSLYENNPTEWAALHCAAYCLYRDWSSRYLRTAVHWQAEADYHIQCLQAKGFALSGCTCQEEE